MGWDAMINGHNLAKFTNVLVVFHRVLYYPH